MTGFPAGCKRRWRNYDEAFMTRVAKSVCVRDTWVKEPPVVPSPDLSNIYITN